MERARKAARMELDGLSLHCENSIRNRNHRQLLCPSAAVDLGDIPGLNCEYRDRPCDLQSEFE